MCKNCRTMWQASVSQLMLSGAAQAKVQVNKPELFTNKPSLVSK